jgi:nucleoside-diphosphate-sugar epimerase
VLVLSPNRILRVAVTGAAGMIGYNLLQELCSGSVFVSSTVSLC